MLCQLSGIKYKKKKIFIENIIYYVQKLPIQIFYRSNKILFFSRFFQSFSID